MDHITTSGMAFRDQFGRQRIFHGINLVHKGTPLPSGGRDYAAPWGEAEIAQLAGWGFNLVRLGVIWDALEPEPGVYDEAYLAQTARLLDLCARHGMHAFLDMHQDLYSALYSDGAPAWATLSDAPFDPTALWSDAYLSSPAVQQAFDAFWADAPAPDGAGLLEHFTALWALLAQRFGAHPALIGYDILNEPFPGSAGQAVFGALLAALAELRAAAIGEPVTAEEMLAMFSDPQARLEALTWLEDPVFYQALAQASEPAAAVFEREVLNPFYGRVAAAIRAETRHGIILRTNGYFSNIGIPCAASPIRVQQAREPLQAYAPHGYDLVVDTDALALASNVRVNVIFGAHRQTQLRLRMPVIVGEWGAFGQSADILEHAGFLLDLFDRYQWSHTYWCYTGDFARSPVLAVLRRPYPQAVCGSLLDYGYDRAARIFRMRWREPEGAAAPSEVFLPGGLERIALIGEYEISDGRLRIAPRGGERELRVEF